MRKTIFKPTLFVIVIVVAVLVAVAHSASRASVALAAPPQSGLLCTTSGTPNANFTLTARTGYISLPDGNQIFMWSFANGSGAFQYPGPNLCVQQGDTITITLNNTLAEPVSIIFPGMENVLANGAPAQPQFSGSTLTSLAQVAPPGGSVTYSFVASQPGTYLYESGTDMGKQVQMGLFGALVVRPSAGAQYAYDTSTRFNTSAEFVMLFSELDPFLHQAIERNQAYDVTTYHPRYWMINGRAFPDTIAPNNAVWLPSQPYGALVHIRPRDASNPDPALVRYLNVGSLNHPFHPHGNHGRVIARDARTLRGPTNQDLSYEKFAVTIGGGQTWDATYDWADVEGWTPANPIPVTIPQLQNLQFKDNATWYSGSPYLGYRDDLPSGVVSFNECGEYYMVWHSHALNEAANFDAGFGGMMTLQRIDPPLPNTCP
ncbi:MAG: multicopper oxidase domain-containing protein [Chloroflexi bacterium]|nr:multicopper oxidase domain-containing protein [Chloroflexota bacterium]